MGGCRKNGGSAPWGNPSQIIVKKTAGKHETPLVFCGVSVRIRVYLSGGSVGGVGSGIIVAQGAFDSKTTK